MKKKSTHSGHLALGAILILGMACSTGSGGHWPGEPPEDPPQDATANELGDTNLIHEPSTETETEEYWTEERMAGALPVEPPTPSDEELERLLQPPAPDVPILSIEGSPIEDETFEEEPAEMGEPTKANVNKRPFWNGGKFFFTKPGEGDYYCSAEFVGSKRVVMTAAHCVTDGDGGWYKNFKFKRAYKDGGGQSVGWKCMAVKTAYFNGGDHAYDYAFIYTNKKSGAGWLGFRTGVPYSSWWSIGYPKDYSGGKYMYKVEGTKGSVGSGVVEMLDNPMGGGSSGGAWIGDLQSEKGGNYAIGLNSYHYVSEPDNEFSPYFNSTTFDLLTYVMDKGCMD